MKRLMLLRHAKAEAGGRGMIDRDRPLAERGVRDAGLMGRAMEAHPLPDLVLCSPAVRTRQTLAYAMAAWPRKPQVDYIDELYGERDATYAGVISRHGGGARHLLVVGHNPTIHMTAVDLASAPGAQLTAKMPTCGLVVIDFDAGSWPGIGTGAGTLVSFVRPRDLGAADADD